MRIRKLLIVSVGILILVATVLWISGCGTKAGAQSAKNGASKATPAACPMAKAGTASCPMMKDDASNCQKATCSDEQKTTCTTEMSCPMMANKASDSTPAAVQATASDEEQKTCPVTGNPIDKNVFTTFRGHTVYFCCPACKPVFEKNPEKYIDKLPQLK